MLGLGVNTEKWNAMLSMGANTEKWNAMLPLGINHGITWYRLCRNLKLGVNHAILSFPSLIGGGRPSIKEKETTFKVDAYIQIPEIGADIRLSRESIIDAEIQEGISCPISGNLILDNSSKIFTKTTGDFYGLFEKGIYSPERETRKFIKFVVKFYDGYKNLIATEYYPRMVILGRTGGIDLSLTLIDEISYYLSNGKVDLPSYVAREVLTRLEDNKTFEAYYLANGYSQNINSELLVNYEQQTSGFAYSVVDEIKTYTFDSEIDEHYAVEAINPLWVGETIKDICARVIDLQGGNIQKEYFQVVCNFVDWQTRKSIEVLGQTPLAAIKPLIDLIPGEYYIDRGENTLSLVIQKTKNVSEYPSTAKNILSEKNSRGKIEVNPTGLFAFNRINIIKPPETGTVYREVVA